MQNEYFRAPLWCRNSYKKGKKVYIPNGKTTIHEGDRVVIFCLKDDLSKIEPYFYKTKRGILNELWNSSKNHR